MTQAEKKAKEEEAKKQAEQNEELKLEDSNLNPDTRGFVLTLAVREIDTIKPRKANKFKNSDGEEVEYGHAVKFNTRLIELVDDEDWGEKEIESTLEVEIPCTTLEETKNLNQLLKTMKSNNTQFAVDIRPSNQTNKIYTTKTLMSGSQFIVEHTKK